MKSQEWLRERNQQDARDRLKEGAFFAFAALSFAASLWLTKFLNHVPEQEEVMAAYARSDLLKKRLAFFSEMSSPSNDSRRTGDGDPFAMEDRPANRVFRSGYRSCGYFTFEVTGFGELSDEHRTREIVTVHFIKDGGKPVALTREFTDLAYPSGDRFKRGAFLPLEREIIEALDPDYRLLKVLLGNSPVLIFGVGSVAYALCQITRIKRMARRLAVADARSASGP
jgi:hypothetical protein